MPLQPADFTHLAAARRLFPGAHFDPSTIEGPYCAVRPTHSHLNATLHVRIFADLMEAEEWARSCPCGSASPHDHFVRVIEPLQPADSVAFARRTDWTHHHAAELLQKWACLAERLALGPATESELNDALAAAEASGLVSWPSADPIAHPSECLPALHWAHSHSLVRAQYRDDLATIEFTL